MPEEKITRQSIRDHFRRMWVWYLAGIAIVLFLNNLFFTVTRPSFSDGETLKIMLLNTSAAIDEEKLLQSIGETGIQCVQTEELAFASADDSTSNMLLMVKLTAGFGDIYITDESGLMQLNNRAACLDLADIRARGFEPVTVIHPESGETLTGALKTPDGKYLVIPSNSTNIQEAKTALPLLAAMITE